MAKIYTVWNQYFGYYDVNMLVLANNAQQARTVAQRERREDYRGWTRKRGMCKPNSSTVRLVTQDLITDLELKPEIRKLKRVGSFVIYDEGS